MPEDKETKFYVTHYYTVPKEEGGWIKVAYLSSTEKNLSKGIYHNGQEKYRNIPESILEEMIEDGVVVKLLSPEPISKNQGLWLTENSEIYLADKNNPRAKMNPKKLLGIEEFVSEYKVTLNSS